MSTYECKLCNRTFDNHRQLNGHMVSHKEGDRYKVKRKLNIDTTLVSCVICRKVCKGERSLKSHITQMHKGRTHAKRGPKIGNCAWNKGLTKDTDERLRKSGQRISDALKASVEDGSYTPRVMSNEAKSRLSKRMSECNPGGRCKWYEVNGTKVQGTWERDIAVKLTEMGIDWIRPKSIEYISNNIKKRYTPDFYLPSDDIYLEIKGYWWGNDREKMMLVTNQHVDKRFIIIEKPEYEKIMESELVW